MNTTNSTNLTTNPLSIIASQMMDSSARTIQWFFKQRYMKLTLQDIIKQFDSEELFNGCLRNRIFQREMILLHRTRSKLLVYYLYNEIIHLLQHICSIARQYQIMDKRYNIPMQYNGLPIQLQDFFKQFDSPPLWWTHAYYVNYKNKITYDQLYRQRYPKSKLRWQI